MKHFLLILLCVVCLLPGLLVYRATAAEIPEESTAASPEVSKDTQPDFTKEEGKSSYTIPQGNYAVVKQADWYFMWTPESGAEEAAILADAQANDPSLDQSSYLGSFSGTDTSITFEQQQNSGIYQFTHNEDGSYRLDILNRSGEADAGKASHVGYGVYAGANPAAHAETPVPTKTTEPPDTTSSPETTVPTETTVPEESDAPPAATSSTSRAFAETDGNPKTGDEPNRVLPLFFFSAAALLYLIPKRKEDQKTEWQ